jgi:subtilisin-like proprotein convertase family protein
MKSKLLIYALPVLLVMFLLYGYSTQDNPNLDVAPHYSSDQTLNNINPPVSDTATPAGFFPVKWNFNFATVPGVNGGTVGTTYFQGKYYLNKWNAAVLYRYNDDGPGGGPGTLADSIVGYNGGTGAIRDMTVAPDGSGTMYLWGGAAGTALYKMDALGTRIATFTQTGAAYRAIAWDKNRKGFWSCNFAGDIVCRDTLGTVLGTVTSALPGKYGLAFDSTSTADSAYLWVWSQGAATGDPGQLQKVYIRTNTVIATYLFPLVGGTLGIAGGAEMFVRNNELILALNYQNFANVGYKVKDLAPPPSGGTMTVCRNGVGLAIPDNGGNAGAVSDNLTISGIPAGQEIKKIKVTLQSLPHTWIGDIRVWITKGTITDTIVSRPGWTGTGFGNSCDNFTGTVLFDSTGLTSIQNVTPATCATGLTANSTGNFAPKDALSLFQNTGTDPNGVYTIRVSDNASGDTGTLMDWCVTVDYGTITGINNNSALANDFKLSQNYPNPFNPSTTINYTIPKSGLVSLKVFDILGKEVASLVNGQISAGSHSVSFNASALSSGVYFYRIESGNFVDTKKMFLLK